MQISTAFRVLAVTGPELVELSSALSSWDSLRIHRADDPEALTGLGQFDAALLWCRGREVIASAQAAALSDFVHGGGLLVTLGDTPGAWLDRPETAALPRWQEVERLPLTELRVTVQPAGALTSGLGSPLLFRDRLVLTEPPPDAIPLLTVDWHHANHVIAYESAIGRGRLIHVGLNEVSLAAPAVVSLIGRALAGAESARQPRVWGLGLIGYGALGRLHARLAESSTGFRVAGVADRSAARAAAAETELGVLGHTDTAALLADAAVEVVVVGTPPSDHVHSVTAALEAGRHVICEKPFALSLAETDNMRRLAEAKRLALTVYQSRRWDPDFLAIRKAVDSGQLGELFYAETFIGGHGHPCNYWHSHEPVSGGMIFDWGSHYFDWLLQLMPGTVTGVRATAHKRVWHDVTNADQVRVDLTFADGREAGFLQSDVAAAAKPRWYLLGTEGAIVAPWREASILSREIDDSLVEDVLQPADAPSLPELHQPDGHGGIHQTRLALPPADRTAFYRNFAAHIDHGEPLAVPPEQSARNVAVMELAARSILEDGRLITADI